MFWKNKQKQKCEICFINELGDDLMKIVLNTLDGDLELKICHQCEQVFDLLDKFKQRVIEKAEDVKL